MRQIVLDTETTGLETELGHRIIEIGALEMLDRRVTRNSFHYYLNPQREVDAGALEVHGITNEFLHDKPLFADIAEEFLEFIRGAELVIHNAAFDIGFLNFELSLLEQPFGVVEDYAKVVDSLLIAREMHPGQRNSLDALCKRYDIDNSHRSLHGALLDAEILGEVYLAMTGGQVDLGLTLAEDTGVSDRVADATEIDRSSLVILAADAGELDCHRERLLAIDKASDGTCAWLQMDAADTDTLMD